ncbi:hypothetical protein PHMEG_00040614 [Phytophthora megakarya]|uniref:Uncharacterized protein n=1 Tax=Phytophthora megakarya TaxID=4795 RepID=A0A225UDK3_9STRA|nr:hypothetical protein PHMEG_00040614 [Phytophthora megakarya]
MTKTNKANKAFAYITKTAREDRKVTRVLSSWGADEMPVVLDVATLDHSSQERPSKSKREHQGTQCSLGVPDPAELAPASPMITRVEDCLAVVEIPLSDVVAWSLALNNIAAPPVEEKEQTRDRSNHVCPRMDHFLAVIHELIETNRTLAARLTIVKATQMKSNKRQAYTEAKETDSPLEQEPKSKRGKSKLRTFPPLDMSATDRSKKSESHHIVAFMNRFLPEGFVLDDKAADYKDRVLHDGRRVEDAVLAFLKTHNS